MRFSDLIEDHILEIGDGYRAKLRELGGDGPIFLRAGHVKDTHISFKGADRFQRNLRVQVENKIARSGDVIVTTKGNSTGRVSFVTSEMPNFVYSPHLSYWRSKEPAELNPGFLKYWSRGDEFRDQLAGLSASTDMAPYLSLTDQRQLKITLPSLEEQCSIANILGTLDDKIELNRRMNQTLEEMARALFKSWFVDFDPVRAKAEGREPIGMDAETAALFPDGFEESELGLIPEGWKIGNIGEVARNVRNPARPAGLPPKTPYIGLEHMPRGQIALSEWGDAHDTTSGKSAFEEADILFGKLRPYFHKVGFAPVDGVCSTDILVIRPRKPEWFGFLLEHLSSVEFVDYTDATSSGTRMPNELEGHVSVSGRLA